MTTIFHLQPGELDDSFLKRLKALFQDRAVELIVRERQEETEYPFDNPKQADFLEEEIRHYESGGEMVKITLDELRQRAQ